MKTLMVLGLLFLMAVTSVANEVRAGTHRQLSHSEQLTTGKEDTANKYNIDKEIVDLVLERIRLHDQHSNELEEFSNSESVGSDTGSEFAPLLKKLLSVDYSKKSKPDLAAYPTTQISADSTEPYISNLSAPTTMEHSDHAFAVDNGIRRHNKRTERPMCANLNRLIRQIVSSITASLRFDCGLDLDLTDFQPDVMP